MSGVPIYLARHGQTPYNVEKRFQGQNDVDLDETGVRQAHELAENAKGHELQALYCSPLRRARHTADIVGEAIGLTPIPDDRFKEHDTGDWTDRLFADVERESPKRYAAYYATDPEFDFPGGESLEEFMDRVVEGLVAVTAAHVFPALVVCHRGVIRCARSHSDSRGLESFMTWDVPNGTMAPL